MSATCKDCKQEMKIGAGCKCDEMQILDTWYKRIPYNGPGDHCHDCNVKPGQIHHYGCDMERCPSCGGQLLSCDCGWDRLIALRGEKKTT